MNILQWLEAEEAKIAAFFAGLRSHAAVVAAAAQLDPPVDPTAQFGPVPPVQPAPASLSSPQTGAQPATPVAPPPGGNTTDPVAPGYHAPPEALGPAAEQPVSEPAVPVVAPSMTWADFQKLNTIPVVGNFSLELTECPAKVRVMTVARSGYPTDNEYTLTVNGTAHPWNMPLATCTVPADGPTVAIQVAQSAGSNLSMQVQG